jgi:hypothetical protein
MDLHRFWDGVITSSQNLRRLGHEQRQSETARSSNGAKSPKLQNNDFESWAKESYEIRRRSLIVTGDGLGFRRVGIWIAAMFNRLLCFLRATLPVRAGLVTDG